MAGMGPGVVYRKTKIVISKVDKRLELQRQVDELDKKISREIQLLKCRSKRGNVDRLAHLTRQANSLRQKIANL